MKGEQVQGWCRSLAAKLPAQTYDKVFKVLKQGGILIKSRQEDLLSLGPLRMGMRMMGDEAEDRLLAAMTAFGDVNILLADSAHLAAARACDDG